MGADDIIESDEGSDEYYETGQFDEYMHQKFIEPYNEKTFWEELLSELASRDAINEIGFEQLKAMEETERLMKLEQIRAHYASEFEEHGLDNIRIAGDNVKATPKRLQTSKMDS